ncbi:hypothetical protein B8X04_16100 [Brevibacterium casei]|uniref:HTH lysR-type domain-containing protein n=1 Tax=Brevibacterium casei TaxID=33889 RepID=A0A269Z5K7_9MICO|nr:LysR family transcriptional regulator [Brevibacterium casei]PAK93074.1 hypothetical protein B8X04_16100 [Brevibacterium casei]
MGEVTLRQLEYFLAALDDGSITAAARTCNVTQATVSTALNELERSLGVTLLVRSRTAGVHPTAAGSALVSRTRSVLDLAREIPDLAAGEQSALTGTVRVGCVFTLGPYLLPRLIGDFAHAHPQLHVDFVEGATGDLRRELDVGRLDLAITYAAQLPKGEWSQEIVRFRQTIMLARSHPLAQAEQLSFHDVADLPLVIYSQPPSRDRVEGFIRAAGVEPDVRWQSSSPETVRGLVRRGLGYSVGNHRPGAEDPMSDDGIAYIPIADPHPLNAVVALYPKGQTLPRRTRAVLDYCLEEASGWDWLAR